MKKNKVEILIFGILCFLAFAAINCGGRLETPDWSNEGTETTDNWIFLIDKLEEAGINTVTANHVMKSAFSVYFSPTPVLFEHPPSQIEFEIDVLPRMSLLTSVTMDPRAHEHEGDGVWFTISVSYESKRKIIYSRYINPHSVKFERRLIPVKLDLSPWAGKHIGITLQTDCGPFGNCDNDWGGWVEPTITDFPGGNEPRKFKNVVFIVADTLRADVLGAYGNTLVKTPNIDSLAEKGWLFEKCISQSSTTVPSHASFFASKYLKDTGVYSQDTVLGDEFLTMAEIFRRYGFETAAVVSSAAVNPSTGFGQGFDSYYSVPPVYPYHRSSPETNEVVFKWLENNHERPFFLWVHYFDNHGPYDAPAPFVDRYYRGKDPHDPANHSLDVIHNSPSPLQQFNRGWFKDITDIEYLKAKYFGATSHLDDSIGELLSKLQERGLRENTLIVLTADHGESLTEHGLYFVHAGLYNEVLHVPLIIADLGPERIATKVELVDLLPTMLDIMEIPSPAGFKGRSLVPLVKRPVPGGVAFSESAVGYLLSYENSNYKYILHLKSFELADGVVLKKGKVEMYDIIADPKELVDISWKHPFLVRGFKKQAGKWLKDGLRFPQTGTRRVVTPDQIQKLKALGYLQ